MTCHYPNLGSATDWSCHEGNLLQPIRSTTQIWVVTRHQSVDLCSHSRRDVGCLAFAKSFRKIRLESKWNTPLWIIPEGKFSGAKEYLKRWPCFSERSVPNGNLCSISSKWLILVSGFVDRFLVNGTDLYKW